MNHKALLVLEADWYTELPLSTRRLYQRFATGQMQSFRPKEDLTDINYFIQSKGLLVFSGHGCLKKGQRLLLTQQGYLNIEHYLQQVSHSLANTIVILDACYLASNPEQLRASLNLKAVIGFSKQVNWQASSVFMLALLQRWQNSPQYLLDIAILQHMFKGDYWYLMQQLGVVWAYQMP